MTEKICKSCNIYIENGKYCPNCGRQLFPDVGNTIWVAELPRANHTVKICTNPHFDRWTGKEVKK